MPRMGSTEYILLSGHSRGEKRLSQTIVSWGPPAFVTQRIRNGLVALTQTELLQK